MPAEQFHASHQCTTEFPGAQVRIALFAHLGCALSFNDVSHAELVKQLEEGTTGVVLNADDIHQR